MFISKDVDKSNEVDAYHGRHAGGYQSLGGAAKENWRTLVRVHCLNRM